MHLIAATADFKIAERPMSGFPIVLWENMESCTEVNKFLRYYLLRGAIGSVKSWGPTGQALYDFFGFLEAHELSWDAVERDEEKSLIAAYRDYCFEEVKLRRNTVRQRVMYICEFYSFAKKEGWISKLPFSYEERQVQRDKGFLAHTDASGGTVVVRSVMPRRDKTLPKFLSMEQVKTLLSAARNPHHRMIIRMALQTGLRRQELATFPLTYVVDPDNSGRRERNLRVTLDAFDGTGMKTKGGKTREIYIGRSLMKDLHHYAIHLRGERASLSEGKRQELFLNQFGKPFADDGKGIEAMVREIGAKVSLQVHPHMLRHTYATHTLLALQRHRRDARIEPIVFLQNQLGHASISTTMIYLHLINQIADEAVLAYDDELSDWLGAEGL